MTSKEKKKAKLKSLLTRLSNYMMLPANKLPISHEDNITPAAIKFYLQKVPKRVQLDLFCF